MTTADKDANGSGAPIMDALAAAAAQAQGAISGLQSIINPSPPASPTPPENIETAAQKLLDGRDPQIPATVLGEWVRNGELDRVLKYCPNGTLAIPGMAVELNNGHTYIPLQFKRDDTTGHWKLYTAPDDISQATEVQFFEGAHKPGDKAPYDYSQPSTFNAGQLTLGSDPIFVRRDYMGGMLAHLMKTDQQFTQNLFQHGLVLAAHFGNDNPNTMYLDKQEKLHTDTDDLKNSALLNNINNALINHMNDMFSFMNTPSQLNVWISAASATNTLRPHDTPATAPEAIPTISIP